jgi:DNA-binding NtrC family response regulator
VKIIVVDDEPVIADTLVDILKGEGYTAISISNGKSAVEWSEKFQPDIVVSDVVMPSLSGIDTAKAILERLPKCRIILFSGQAASVDLVSKAKAEGYSFEVLAKPVDPDALLNKISEAGTSIS